MIQPQEIYEQETVRYRPSQDVQNAATILNNFIGVEQTTIAQPIPITDSPQILSRTEINSQDAGIPDDHDCTRCAATAACGFLNLAQENGGNNPLMNRIKAVQELRISNPDFLNSVDAESLIKEKMEVFQRSTTTSDTQTAQTTDVDKPIPKQGKISLPAHFLKPEKQYTPEELQEQSNRLSSSSTKETTIEASLGQTNQSVKTMSETISQEQKLTRPAPKIPKSAIVDSESHQSLTSPEPQPIQSPSPGPKPEPKPVTETHLPYTISTVADKKPVAEATAPNHRSVIQDEEVTSPVNEINIQPVKIPNMLQSSTEAPQVINIPTEINIKSILSEKTIRVQGNNDTVIHPPIADGTPKISVQDEQNISVVSPREVPKDITDASVDIVIPFAQYKDNKTSSTEQIQPTDNDNINLPIEPITPDNTNSPANTFTEATQVINIPETVKTLTLPRLDVTNKIIFHFDNQHEIDSQQSQKTEENQIVTMADELSMRISIDESTEPAFKPDLTTEELSPAHLVEKTDIYDSPQDETTVSVYLHENDNVTFTNKEDNILNPETKNPMEVKPVVTDFSVLTLDEAISMPNRLPVLLDEPTEVMNESDEFSPPPVRLTSNEQNLQETITMYLEETFTENQEYPVAILTVIETALEADIQPDQKSSTTTVPESPQQSNDKNEYTMMPMNQKGMEKIFIISNFIQELIRSVPREQVNLPDSNREVLKGIVAEITPEELRNDPLQVNDNAALIVWFVLQVFILLPKIQLHLIQKNKQTLHKSDITQLIYSSVQFSATT